MFGEDCGRGGAGAAIFGTLERAAVLPLVHGIQPQLDFEPVPGAFEGPHDDLLTAALERLRRLHFAGETDLQPADTLKPAIGMKEKVLNGR